MYPSASLKLMKPSEQNLNLVVAATVWFVLWIVIDFMVFKFFMRENASF